MVAIAQVANIDFPLRNPGELISGSVTLKNVGDESTGLEAGFFGVLVRTLWDGQEHTLFAYATIAPGESFTYEFHSTMGGIGSMPYGAANLEVVGRTWLDETWRIDDIISWSISEGGPAPESKPVLPLLLIAAVALLFFGRK